MEEIWKDIYWFDWLYQVSNLWRVKSFSHSKYWKILKTYDTRFARHVQIKWRTYNIMRLIAREHLHLPYWDKRLHLKITEKVNWELIINSDNISVYIPSSWKEIKYLNRYKDFLLQVCSKHNLFLYEEVLSDRRDNYIQKWRAECYITLYRKSVKLETIAKIFNKNHAAIIYTLNKYYWKEYRELVQKYKKDLQLIEKTI